MIVNFPSRTALLHPVSLHMLFFHFICLKIFFHGVPVVA